MMRLTLLNNGSIAFEATMYETDKLPEQFKSGERIQYYDDILGRIIEATIVERMVFARPSEYRDGWLRHVYNVQSANAIRLVNERELLEYNPRPRNIETILNHSGEQV